MSPFPDGIQTTHVPDIPSHITEAFSRYQDVKPCDIKNFADKSSLNPLGIYFMTRPLGNDSEEVHYAASLDDEEAERVTFLTGGGAGNTISEWIPIPGDEDVEGNYRPGGALFHMDTNGEEQFRLCRFLPVTENENEEKEMRKIGVGERTQHVEILRHEKYTVEFWTPKGKLNQWTVLSNKGDRIAYSNNMINGKDKNVFFKTLVKRDPEEPLEGVPVVTLPGAWAAVDWSQDDKKLFILNMISAGRRRVFIMDTEAPNKMEELLLPLIDENGQPQKTETGETKYAQKLSGRFSKTDNNKLYILSDWMSDFMSFVRYDLVTKEIQPITTPIKNSIFPLPWDVETLALSEKHLAFATNEDGYSVLYVMDLTNDTVRRVDLPSDIPRGVISKLKFAKSNSGDSFLALQTDSVYSPGSIHLLSLSDFTIRPYKSTQSAPVPHPTSVPHVFRYPSFDNLSIPALIYLPATHDAPTLSAVPVPPKPLPVVIYIHGGPASQTRPSYNPRLHFQFVAQELGCAVITPNVRGSLGYGLKFLALDDGLKREDSVRDIGALLDYILAHFPFLDPARVSVRGRSYGGYMVLASLVHYSDRLKCGMCTCGIADFINFLETTAPHRRDLRRPEYGDERIPEMRAFLERISPLNNVDKIKVPLYLSYGKMDTRVPFSEFEKMRDKSIEVLGNDRVWTFVAENEGHIFRQRSVNDCNELAMAAFMEKFL